MFWPWHFLFPFPFLSLPFSPSFVLCSFSLSFSLCPFSIPFPRLFTLCSWHPFPFPLFFPSLFHDNCLFPFRFLSFIFFPFSFFLSLPLSFLFPFPPFSIPLVLQERHTCRSQPQSPAVLQHSAESALTVLECVLWACGNCSHLFLFLASVKVRVLS